MERSHYEGLGTCVVLLLIGNFHICLRYYVIRRYAFCFLVIESRHCSCFTPHPHIQYLGWVPRLYSKVTVIPNWNES
jgi:hypothetical protein